MNLFAAGDALIDSFNSQLGESIILSDSGYTCELTATVVGDGRLVNDVAGNLIQHNGLAFHITAADLVLNGKQETPRPGMRITRSNGEVYEISRPGGQEECYDQLGDGSLLVLRAVQVK